MANVVTKSQIARELGVSVTSVATVLNEKPIRMSPELMRRIVLKAKEMGYNFNSGRNHRSERKEIAYLIVTPRVDPKIQLSGEYLNMLNGIHEAVDGQGYKVSYLGCLDVEKALKNVSHFHDDSGVVLTLTGYIDERLIEPLQELEVPFVVMGSYEAEKENFNRIIVDYQDAAHKATSALIQAGAKRILCVLGQWSKRINRSTYKGYKTALDAANIPLYPELVQSYDDQPRFIPIKLETMGIEYDGVVSGATTAFEFSIAARTKGIRVPEDLKIISTRDDELLTKVAPAISCMRLDQQAYGEAFNNFIGTLNNGFHEPVEIRLQKQYVERESSRIT